MPHDDDLDRELRSHLELEAEEQRNAGVSDDQAAYAARRALGNTTGIKEAVHELSGWISLECFWQDVRYGVRLLGRSPGFTLVAVLTLALGIGANTAIFSVVNAFLLRPLPYPDPDRMVRLWPTDRQNRLSPFAGTSYPNFVDWRTQSRAFEQVEIYVSRSMNLTGSEEPERLHALRISPGLLPLLRISPMLGRTFLEDEIQPGRDRVALLSERVWRRRFAADPSVLGKNVKFNDESYTIIGVLPPAFQFPPNEPAEVVLPQPPDPSRTHGFVNVVARLKPRAIVREAQAELDAITRDIERQYPKENQGEGVRVLSLHESYVGAIRMPILLFLSAVGFVLLIACANVANLFMARIASRQKELVVRAALGAKRLRLVRQLLTESALVALAGGALGLVVAIWAMNVLMAMMRKNFPVPDVQLASLDVPVLVFTLTVSLLVGVLSGLAPALAAFRMDPNDTLKDASRAVTASRLHTRVRNALVVAEIALALILLVGAGLMLKSFLLLQRVHPGLDPSNLLTIDLAMSGRKYAKAETRTPLVQEALERVRQIPDVVSAAVVTDLPLTSNEDSLGIVIQGRPDLGRKKLIVRFNIAGPGFLRTMGIPLYKGRDFSDSDAQSAPVAVLINQAMATRYWQNVDPIGARISMDGQHWFTIVGVVGDIHQTNLQSPPRPEVYLSYLQDPYGWPFLTLLVRTAHDPLPLTRSVRGAIWSVDKDLPMSEAHTMEQILSKSMAQPRVFALLLSIFATLALVLAIIGIYGVIAYSVTQRTHEMGVRMALGAHAADVFKLVVGRGMLLALLGVAIGLAGALALTRLLAKFLFAVQPTDPPTFVLVALALGAAALVASYIPARRATKVDPMVALRYQ